MMRLTCVLVLFLISCININKNKDEFEGKIVFLGMLENKGNSELDENVLSCHNDTMTVYMKNGHFKQIYHQYKLMKEIIYNPEDKLYNIINRSDTIYSMPVDKTYGITLKNLIELDTLVDILGYQCKAFKLNYSNNESNTYYYTNELKVNPIHYKDHKMGFYNEFVNKTESVYLMSVWETPNLKLTYKAVDISKEKVDNKMFKLPDLPRFQP